MISNSFGPICAKFLGDRTEMDDGSSTPNIRYVFNRNRHSLVMQDLVPPVLPIYIFKSSTMRRRNLNDRDAGQGLKRSPLAQRANDPHAQSKRKSGER